MTFLAGPPLMLPALAAVQPSPLQRVLGSGLGHRAAADLAGRLCPDHLDRVPDHQPWWLGMVAGILEIFAGFWASQQLVTVSAALLVIWVGVLALFNGINQIVLAFELKSAQHR